MTIEDLQRQLDELRYELPQAQNRLGWKYGPQGAGDPQEPGYVETEIPPADGTGAAVSGGRVYRLTHDDTGAATQGEVVDVWNIFQARIPIDVTVWIEQFRGKWYLVSADCDPAGPELIEAQSTTSVLISDISYTAITPTLTISRPGIYDFRYSVQLQATLSPNTTLAYQLQLWDATNSVELGNTGPVGQTRASSGIVVDNGSFFGDLDGLAAATDIQLRALDVGDGTLDSTIGDFLQSFGPL